MENINSAFQNTHKQISHFKSKVWDNKTSRIVLLFVLAALLVSVFCYHQYARRHYTLSSASQRLQNQQLKSKLDELSRLNKTLDFLQNVESNIVLQPEFASRLDDLRINKINH